ncbi:MAG: tryptophan--tRNA ligase [Bdellovibrio sp.]|nr:MAG: tryptophan--tRNA ligase [Bdellovibrio sp.]
MKKVVLTGVKPTGQPHIGNYLGAMKPALAMAEDPEVQSFLFLADYHSLTHVHDPKKLKEWTLQLTAAWLACGLNPQKTVIYRQSDIPEIFELLWVLSCFTPKGFMNRAHAYKAKVQENQEKGIKDLDKGVNMGLYSYPILMTADILLFSANEVPVGEDQIQHVEFARDIAQKVNHVYGEVFTLPQIVIKKNTKVIPGLDGRKMSKSYNNYIPLFEEPKKLRKLIMKIKTNSLPPEAPKDPEDSILFTLFREFASQEEVQEMEEKYRKGIGWGEAKERLFEVMERELGPKRELYKNYMDNPSLIIKTLEEGAEKARVKASSFMKRIRKKIGITLT